MTGNRATNLQNRVTRNKQAMVLAMLLILGVVSRSYAGWPFNRTPAIEGVVTDATTGEPIEKVVVACGWLKSVPSFGGDVTSSFAGEVCVTGKDGRYKIPAKTTFHLYSRFGGTMIGIYHPLYETKREFGDSDGIMVDHVEVNKSPDGIVHADVKLMGLVSAYGGEEVAGRSSLVASEEGEEVTSHKSHVTSEEEKGKIGSGFFSYLNVHENGWYWLTLREKNIPFDLEETFKVWDKIVEEYRKYDGDLPWKLEKTKEKIREKLRGEKS